LRRGAPARCSHPRKRKARVCRLLSSGVPGSNQRPPATSTGAAASVVAAFSAYRPVVRLAMRAAREAGARLRSARSVFGRGHRQRAGTKGRRGGGGGRGACARRGRRGRRGRRAGANRPRPGLERPFPGVSPELRRLAAAGLTVHDVVPDSTARCPF
jgi:hypothetical protein